MYEVTLSVENENWHFLDYIEKSMSPVLAKIKAISASEKGYSRSYFSFACVDTYKKQICDVAATLATDVIGIGYKNLFLRKKLQLDESNFLVNTLVDTMCVFDSNFDRQYIKRILEMEGRVCLDGYFNFRLQRLKEKWNEIVELTNSNNVILSDDNLIQEFLAYLIEAIPQNVKNLSVVVDKSITLYDSQNKVLPSIDILRVDATAEELAIVNIICLKPSTVTLYCDPNKVDSQFLALTSYLFETTVVENV